uniref:AAA+ ATPase domain-containing protein n=1 Tax=Meloidogyne enterolobii TaxID=390850 RepID=A0A6V7W4G8_MELEN|nr:unnamed protein product [Meloidogyne enterolobii]
MLKLIASTNFLKCYCQQTKIFRFTSLFFKFCGYNERLILPLYKKYSPNNLTSNLSIITNKLCDKCFLDNYFLYARRVPHPKSSRPVRSYEPSNRSANEINENQNKEFDKENGKENDFEKAKAEFDKFDKNMKDAHKELKQGMENLFKETFESDKIRKDAQKEAKQTMEKLVGKEMANKLDKEVDKLFDQFKFVPFIQFSAFILLIIYVLNKIKNFLNHTTNSYLMDMDQFMRRLSSGQGVARGSSQGSSIFGIADENFENFEGRKRKIFIFLIIFLAIFFPSPHFKGAIAPEGPPPLINGFPCLFKILQVSNIVLVPNYYSKSKKQSKPVIGRAFVYPVSFSETQNTQVGVLHVPDLRKFTEQLRNKEIELNIPPERWVDISFYKPSAFSYLIPIILFGIMISVPLFLTFRLSRKIDIKEMFSIGQRIRIVDPASKEGKKNLKIKFRDVAGLHEAKREVMEIVDYLRKPQKYVQLGARLPKGALLTGPPGCGKTLLAKALAAESSVPFINVNGTEFVEMIGGLGASRVRQLFKKAKSSAPCIIYIDEIDALGRKRQNQSSGNDEMEQTLNQLLVEMDGMDSNKGVVVVGSTNRVDMLDKALLRPGRFDRHITIDLPTLLERKELFDLYLQKIKKENLLTGVSQRLAQMTPGFSGADIKNVVNEAAIHAATAQKKMVKIADIDFALQKIVAGPEKRSRVLIKEEREIVAFHESGHALVGWLLEHTEALLRVTIIPRTSAALGFAQYSPKDRKLFTKEELFDRMCMMLGGRVAENVIFGKITTGAQNDLEKVTKQAQAMVKWYGMSELIGPISFFPGADADLRSADFTEKPYSKKLGNMIDQEIGKLVADAYYSTENLLRENKDKLEVIAKALLERETLNYEDVKRLIGPPKFGNKQVVDLPEDVLPDLPNNIESGTENKKY